MEFPFHHRFVPELVQSRYLGLLFCVQEGYGSSVRSEGHRNNGPKKGIRLPSAPGIGEIRLSAAHDHLYESQQKRYQKEDTVYG